MAKNDALDRLISDLDEYRDMLKNSGCEWRGELVADDLHFILLTYRAVS